MGGVAALICAICFGLFMLSAMLVMLKLVKTMQITNLFLDDVRKETVPLLTRLQVTLDHVNTELDLADRIMGSAELLTRRVAEMSGTFKDSVVSPVVKVISMGPVGKSEEEVEPDIQKSE